MGGGSYSYTRDTARKLSNSVLHQEEVFKQRTMSDEMNIKNKIRECRDSEEHPETLPIIIALDVTGSMGSIPRRLVTQDFPNIMKKIMDESVAHPQVCFLGIGDHECDSAPLQVGQFEASDELLDTWLRKLYIEGGGGGNDGESYLLAWWFASACTDCDAYNKRGRKGILITVGDEPTLRSLTKRDFSRIYGTSPQADCVAASDILKEAQDKWDVYHINVMDYAGNRKTTIDQWTKYLGDHLINTQSRDGSDVAELIARIIVSSAKGDGNKSTAEPVAQTPAQSSEDTTTHLR